MTVNNTLPKLPSNYNFAKINRIIIEIVSVMFAVLVALGVDQWWEDRENLELAAKLKVGIENEIKNNLEEIKGTHENYTSTNDSLIVYLSKPEIDLDNFNLNLELALLTSATWNTAQMLKAIHSMDYEWIIEVSTVYELQTIYLESQKQFLDVMGRLAEEDIEENPKKMFRVLVGRLMILNTLQEGLIEGYSDLLNENDSGSS
ncbi:MAG: hypothetical protein HQ528_09990 [Candidatus Marinimicrobia bacterium]|nr:hypothetical protein [Candidatus Neomarinimicrobiota bacterium]